MIPTTWPSERSTSHLGWILGFQNTADTKLNILSTSRTCWTATCMLNYAEDTICKISLFSSKCFYLSYWWIKTHWFHNVYYSLIFWEGDEACLLISTRYWHIMLVCPLVHWNSRADWWAVMMSSTSASPDQGSGSVPGCGWPWQPDAKAMMPLNQSMMGTHNNRTWQVHFGGCCGVNMLAAFATIVGIIVLIIIPLIHPFTISINSVDVDFDFVASNHFSACGILLVSSMSDSNTVNQGKPFNFLSCIVVS